MRQIIYGPICMLQDPRFVKYDSALDKWYLDENAVNIEFCAVANAGATGIRLLPWGVWAGHPYGVKSQFQPYVLNADCTAFNLGAFNDWYFPIVKRVIEIANTYGLKVWWAWGDNCQFSGAYRKWSPWSNNTQGIGSFYETAAYSYFSKWIQKCRTEFAGLNVAWAWGNEVNNPGMRALAEACIFPILNQFDPKEMTYGASMKDAPYLGPGEYSGNAGMLDTLKGMVGTVFGDKVKLAIWKEVHGVGGKGYPKVPNRLDQALSWWARSVNNGIRIWLSDDGTKDGDSECDVAFDGARPSAERWAEIVKIALKYENDFTFEHLPQDESPAGLPCQVKTLKAIYKAVYGKDPVEKYHYDPPVPPEPPEPPTPPPVDCKCSYWLEKGGDGKRDWTRWFKCLFGGEKRCK